MIRLRLRERAADLDTRSGDAEMYLLVKDAWRWNGDAPNYEVLCTSCQLTQVPQASESDSAPRQSVGLEKFWVGVTRGDQWVMMRELE